uniref:Uncharacterized protein n=1 Tax=Knipowitschia caucasica TaxID=637954 RepID=A0AAV2IVQ1_KNICA
MVWCDDDECNQAQSERFTLHRASASRLVSNLATAAREGSDSVDLRHGALRGAFDSDARAITDGPRPARDQDELLRTSREPKTDTFNSRIRGFDVHEEDVTFTKMSSVKKDNNLQQKTGTKTTV